ncbi:MAG: hypothetical protein ACLTC0_07445 [Eisenbergiella massiliensis]|uniref:hypothetical protein n=1 Tax=Eisenbergiella massiliensis TaxID=1720294 RepID=UPI0039934BB0
MEKRKQEDVRKSKGVPVAVVTYTLSEEELLISKGCFRGPRHCRNAATRKKHLKTDQVSFYLPLTKGGIIFSRVLDMEHLPGRSP